MDHRTLGVGKRYRNILTDLGEKGKTLGKKKEHANRKRACVVNVKTERVGGLKLRDLAGRIQKARFKLEQVNGGPFNSRTMKVKGVGPSNQQKESRSRFKSNNRGK